MTMFYVTQIIYRYSCHVDCILMTRSVQVWYFCDLGIMLCVTNYCVDYCIRTICRNVSSNSELERAKLRNLLGLIGCLLTFLQTALTAKKTRDRDNQIVLHCMCALRNLSYALQETVDRGYLRRREEHVRRHSQRVLELSAAAAAAGSKSKSSTSGSSRRASARSVSGRKGSAQDELDACGPPPPRELLDSPPTVREEVAFLWSPRSLHLYFQLLSDSCNQDTVEAVVGCLQNLTACEWQVNIH